MSWNFEFRFDAGKALWGLFMFALGIFFIAMAPILLPIFLFCAVCKAIADNSRR